MADIGKWVGQPRVTKVRAAIAALGDEIVPMGLRAGGAGDDGARQLWVAYFQLIEPV
jgi:hypothetical protein